MSVGDRVAEPVASSPKEPVLYEIRDTGVVVLTLNRPERMNGWGGGLATTFYARLDDAEADLDVRAIVVTGKGRAFCAGADMGDLTSISSTTVDAATDTDVGKLVGARHPHFVTTMRKPVIAAINGACAGMGLTMALACDVRFAAEGAKFTTSFARRGLIAEYGISWLLRRLVGHGRARDLLLSARVVTGAEAHRIGLVEHLAEPGELVDAALAYAADLAENCSPTSLAIIKSQLSRDAETGLGAAIVEAETLMRESFERADVVEGVTSYRERRAPAFPPLPARS